MSLGFSYGYSQGGTDYLTRVSNGLGRTLDLAYSGTHISVPQFHIAGTRTEFVDGA